MTVAAIETLAPGTAIRLTGDVAAVVAENPRDGAWLVARCRGADARAAAAQSAHGYQAIDARTDDLVVVHADDILAADHGEA